MIRTHFGVILPLAFLSMLFSVSAQWSPLNGPYGGGPELATGGGDTVFAGTSNGLYRSLDGARTWTRLAFAERSVAIIGRAGGLLFVSGTNLTGTASGYDLLRSSDGGETFTAVVIMRPDGARLRATAVGRHRGLFYVNDALASDPIMMVSADTCVTWTAVEMPKEVKEPILAYAERGDTAYAVTGRYFLARPSLTAPWAVLHTFGSMLGLGRGFLDADGVFLRAYTNLMRSTNGGRGWIPVRGQTSGIVRASDGRFYAGTVDGGLFVSEDSGATWAPFFRDGPAFGRLVASGGRLLFTQASLYAVEIASASATRADAGIAALTVERLSTAGGELLAVSNFLNRSTDGGATWADLVPNELDVRVELPVVRVGGVLLGGGNSMRRSLDGGRTWAPVADTLAAHSVVGFAVDGGAVYAAMDADASLIRSLDSGRTWAPLLRRGSRPFGLFARPPLLLVVTEDRVLRSLDSGRTWDSVAISLSAPLGEVRMAMARSGTLMMVIHNSPNAARRSLDSGRTWVRVPIDVISVDDVVAIGDTFLLATRGGVYAVHDTATTATRYDPDFPYAAASITADDRWIYLGTRGMSVWRAPRSTAAVRDAPDRGGSATGDAVALRAEPNPTAERAYAAFRLAAPADVRLEIEDLFGRTLRVERLGAVDAGEHRAAVDCAGLPTGTYFLRLMTPSATRAVRVVIVR